MRKWTIYWILTAILFIICGSIGIFHLIYRNQVDKKTNLVENSFLYPLWRDLPLPIYKKLYFFNITNAEAFLHDGVAMEVEEVGPYVYIGNWTKEDITWTNEGTVNYREVKTFHFSLEESAGSENDKIYTLNAPYIAASNVLKNFGSTVRKAANTLLSSYNLIIYKSIKELAFEGYEDPIMDVSKFYQWNSPFTSGSFAWFYSHNATDEGDFEVFTGETDHTLLNVIYKWNGFKDLNFWKGKYCNMINGTNAEFHSPIIYINGDWFKGYTFFQPLVCRSITYRYSQSMHFKGMSTVWFQNEADIFSRDNPDNHCFLIDPELKSGALDVSNCWYGAPVILSFPHFFLADTSFLENVKGLSPNRKDHGSHIAVETTTGVTTDLSIKFQMNLRIKPVEELKAFENVTAGIYPVFWLDIKVELPDNLIDIIRRQLYRPWNVGLSCIGVVAVIFFFYWTYYQIKHRDALETKLPEYKEPLLKKNTSKFSLNSFDPHKSSLSDIINNDDLKSGSSFKTCDSISRIKTQYQSYNNENSEEKITSEVEVQHSNKRELSKRLSFKDARTLTVI